MISFHRKKSWKKPPRLDCLPFTNELSSWSIYWKYHHTTSTSCNWISKKLRPNFECPTSAYTSQREGNTKFSSYELVLDRYPFEQSLPCTTIKGCTMNTSVTPLRTMRDLIQRQFALRLKETLHMCNFRATYRSDYNNRILKKQMYPPENFVFIDIPSIRANQRAAASDANES